MLTCLQSGSHVSGQLFNNSNRASSRNDLEPCLASLSRSRDSQYLWGPQRGTVVFSFSGEWRVFSGNELGALLGWWLFTCWKEKNQDASALKDTYMLSSTVSSKILRAIALKEGFHFEVRFLGETWSFAFRLLY